MAMMRALLSTLPGGPDTLTVQDIPEPSPGPGQVRIAVRACGVNFPDTLIIEDKYQTRPPRPFSPGAEVSGIVDALGAGVTGLTVGQRVIGWANFGGMVEKMVLPEADCIAMPDSMKFETGAGLLMTYGTSHYALADRAALKSGETLLVLGAAGGVGLAAVELGRATGARVIAAVSSEEKAAVARAHGADRTLVYPTGPFDADGRRALAKSFKEAVGEGGADVIYDPVGGDYSEAALRAIAWEGRLLVVGFPAGIAKLPLNLALLKNCQVVGVFWGAFVAREPGKNRENAMELVRLCEAGLLHPKISKIFPLPQAGDAITELAQRKALGKLVVSMTASEVEYDVG